MRDNKEGDLNDADVGLTVRVAFVFCLQIRLNATEEENLFYLTNNGGSLNRASLLFKWSILGQCMFTSQGKPTFLV